MNHADSHLNYHRSDNLQKLFHTLKMTNNKKVNISKVYNLLFHLLLSFTVFQLVCPFYSLFTNIRPDIIAALGIVAIFVYQIYKLGLRKIVGDILEVLYVNKLLAILCVAYFVWDSINLLYANDIAFLKDKYLIWAKIGFVCLNILYYVKESQNHEYYNSINSIFKNLGITSVLISIIAYIGFYTGKYTQYDKMLTTISDHNVFSSAIMFGFISIVGFVIINNKYSILKKAILLICITVICIPSMYLSASRRTIILLWMFLLWMGIWIICKFFIIAKSKGYNLIVIAVAVLIAYALIIGHIEFFKDYSVKESVSSNYKTEQTTGTIKESGEVDEYVSTISDDSGLDLRILIWKTTLKWYADMTPIQKICGGGASYHSDIFNDIDHPNNKMVVEHYNVDENARHWMRPHNFILEDLMTGGIIKVIIDFVIMIVVLVKIIKGLLKYTRSREYNIVLMCLYVTLLGNLFMGAYYGLFGNRYTWIIIAIDFVIRYAEKSETKKVQEEFI